MRELPGLLPPCDSPLPPPPMPSDQPPPWLCGSRAFSQDSWLLDEVVSVGSASEGRALTLGAYAGAATVSEGLACVPNQGIVVVGVGLPCA